MTPRWVDSAKALGSTLIDGGARGLAAFRAAVGPRRRKLPIMQPYTNLRSFKIVTARFLFPFFFGFICLVYGFFFALTAPYLIVPFTVPIGVLVLLSIWALPDRPHAPTKTMEFFFAGLLIALVIWPNYLALALPGLPWITALRLTGFPMAFFLLICLSTSAQFRSELSDTIRAVPGLWSSFIAFTAIQFLTIPLAKYPLAGLQKAIIEQINWTAVFVISAWVCRIPGRVERYVGLLIILSFPIIGLTILETREQHVIWSGHVPSFLKVDDPVAALILSSTVRGATGLYRTKATFSTPLGLSEFLALLTPFAIHFIFGDYRFWLRVVGAALLPTLFYCIRMTDARLGVVGFLVSILLYVLFWGLMRLRKNTRDLIAAAVVYAYPAFFAAAATAVMVFHRLNVLVFGGGAQVASNEARKNQLHMGIPKILANPIGHGPGGSGLAMGYSADSFITIDNYYLSLGLDFGVIGLASFLATFLLTIGWSARAAIENSGAKGREIALLAPLLISLCAFLVIKSVFSQNDNHPMIYALLGAAVALVYRVRVQAGAASSPAASADRARNPLRLNRSQFGIRDASKAIESQADG